MNQNRQSLFGFEQPEDSPGFLLWQTTITWQRLIKKVLEPFEISHAQFVLLAILLWLEEHKQQTTQAALIGLSKLDKMTVSKSLKKLATMGLIHRVEHQTDTRAKNVTITGKGINFVQKLVPQVEAIDAQFFAKIKNNEQNTLIALLKKLVEIDDKTKST